MHRNDKVQQAIMALLDALTEDERSSHIESLLILNDTSGFKLRAINGKPHRNNDYTDADLLELYGL